MPTKLQQLRKEQFRTSGRPRRRGRRMSEEALRKASDKQFYGRLGPASPVKRIDPKTGEVVEIISGGAPRGRQGSKGYSAWFKAASSSRHSALPPLLAVMRPQISSPPSSDGAMVTRANGPRVVCCQLRIVLANPDTDDTNRGRGDIRPIPRASRTGAQNEHRNDVRRHRFLG
jgi:hypothetical protein